MATSCQLICPSVARQIDCSVRLEKNPRLRLERFGNKRTQRSKRPLLRALQTARGSLFGLRGKHRTSRVSICAALEAYRCPPRSGIVLPFGFSQGAAQNRALGDVLCCGSPSACRQGISIRSSYADSSRRPIMPPCFPSRQVNRGKNFEDSSGPPQKNGAKNGNDKPRIKQLRLEHGWSLKELATQLDITENDLSRVEAGKRGLQLKKLKAAARIFKVPLADLMNLGSGRTVPTDALRAAKGLVFREGVLCDHAEDVQGHEQLPGRTRHHGKRPHRRGHDASKAIGLKNGRGRRSRGPRRSRRAGSIGVASISRPEFAGDEQLGEMPRRFISSSRERKSSAASCAEARPKASS